MKKALIILGLLNALFLGIGLQVPQENPEELFLSDERLTDLQELQRQFGNAELVFTSGINQYAWDELSSYFEEHKAEISSLDPLMPSNAVLKMPILDDVGKFYFFKHIEEKYPKLKFAGESYTNAHLAGMSLKIQEVLFPTFFGLIFLGLLLFTRSLSSSAYLFLSSLLGVGIGLSVIRLFFHHSTILTTLTPLIGFVLTLGVQLHVVYGLARYKDLNIFLKKKLHPLYIMMITTLIGFLSLISSNLPAIRQLSITASLNLAITWCILLLILKYCQLSFKLTPPEFIKRKMKIPGPNHHAVPGYIILIVLIMGGLLGIKKMPLLIEATEFFPKTHKVQEGFQQIKNDLGGTPQFELVITKKDESDLGFEDYQNMANFEEKLQQQFPSVRFISVNNLVKYANEKYSGTKTLPDNTFSYEALSGKIPSILRENQLSEKAYRISYISPILQEQQRVQIKDKLLDLSQQIDTRYKIKLSGFTYLILESQSHLVDSLIKSFFISFVFIIVIFALFSRKMNEVFIFGILNFASILGGLMWMWISGMTLNVSSVMTVSISMGLVVDSTVHLLYAEKTNETRDNLYFTTLTPIVLSHILLFFSFTLLAFESFVPIRDFSLGLVILIFVGLICDLYVLPLIQKDNHSQI